jgi:hypothetical protein
MPRELHARTRVHPAESLAMHLWVLPCFGATR